MRDRDRGFPRHQRSLVSSLIGEPHGTAGERKNLMRTAVASAAALAWIVSSSSFALADGMPGNRGPAYAPFSWTGFYIGANGGYGDNYDRNDNFILSNSLGPITTTRGVQPEGGFGGGQLGYNWQQGPLLLGVETDLQGADVSAGFARRLLADGDLLNAHQSFNYFGTVRGRVGFAFYRGLIYVTGGFAYGGVRDQLLVFNPGSGFSANLHNDDTRTGSVIGGGVELALAPHWSVKVEYQYIDLGSERLAASLPPSGSTITSNKLMDIAGTARIGLNYRFDTDHYYVPSK
jgi:outer membrane immunogenic protein